jgi:azurin
VTDPKGCTPPLATNCSLLLGSYDMMEYKFNDIMEYKYKKKMDVEVKKSGEKE